MSTILVVDDDPGIRGLLDQTLRRKAYSVVFAADGDSGFDLFRRISPDAVVLDLNMPGMDGMMLLEKVRELNERVPVIILTGPPMRELEHEASLLGATAFLRKASSIHELGNVLKEALEKPAFRSAA
jgi:DNA-binding response OmpR family regulator